MARIEITIPGERVVEEFTALVSQPTSPSTAVPPNIGLVEISQSQPTELIPGPVGPQGPRGSRWTTGTGDPAATGALLGDMYLDDVSGAVWTWDGTAWVNTGTNIQGSPDTGPQILAKLAPVDGAGSGLDADLLDAQSGAYYLAYANQTGKPATYPPTLPIAQSGITNLVSDLALKAPLASPVFTGDPTAPTPATADNDTSIATTAYVKANLASYAPLASPVLSGNPTAPTPSPGDNDTSVATTAFVTAAIAATPANPSDRIVSTPADMSAGFKTAGNRFVINSGPNLDGTDVMTVTETGAVTASGSLAALGVTSNSQVFTGAGTAAMLSPASAGTVNLRPNPGSSAGQTSIDINGTMTVANNMYIGGGAVTGSTATMDINATGTGTIRLRPNNSATGQTTIDSAGAMTVTGQLHVTAPYSATGAVSGTSLQQGVLRTSNTATTIVAHHAFYNPNGLIGQITTTGIATNYATSSDERLKNVGADYDPTEAIRIIREDPVKNFTWKAGNIDAVGWIAQRSHSVHEDLAVRVPPTEAGEKGEPAEEEFWGIDYGRRTPYLWAALTHALDRIEALEARIAALEGAG